MNRGRVASGKFVTISTELAEKAARAFATALTRDQVRELKAIEPRRAKGVIVGSTKPLAVAKALARARPKIASAAPVRKITSKASVAMRRKIG